MKRIIKTLAFFLAVVCLPTACSSDDDDNNGTEQNGGNGGENGGNGQKFEAVKKSGYAYNTQKSNVCWQFTDTTFVRYVKLGETDCTITQGYYSISKGTYILSYVEMVEVNDKAGFFKYVGEVQNVDSEELKDDFISAIRTDLYDQLPKSFAKVLYMIDEADADKALKRSISVEDGNIVKIRRRSSKEEQSSQFFVKEVFAHSVKVQVGDVELVLDNSTPCVIRTTDDFTFEATTIAKAKALSRDDIIFCLATDATRTLISPELVPEFKGMELYQTSFSLMQ